ncbi:MAG: xanthine phosphoribosyltransferase [Lachnospiraceae bacterium]|nr:xanthine phosphoribosyltransferase [Lachnospiraceae bacterium]
MQKLKDRIREEGVIRQGNVLKVDSFLNHQLDMQLLHALAEEFAARFENEEINKVLTIETSGIAIACMVADLMQVPVVIARKTKTKNMNGELYKKTVTTVTKDEYDLYVAKQYLGEGDKVLLIDDLLAHGKALEGLSDMVVESGAELVGIGVAIEKSFQVGSKLIRDKDIRLESLVIVDDLDWRSNKVVFRGDND